MNTHELAWAAGFFDGEGCVSLLKSGRHTYPQVGISQVDRMVLDRVTEAVGFGKVYGPYKTPRKPQYLYSVYGFEKTQALMAFLWPWLSPVKRAQFKRILYAIDN